MPQHAAAHIPRAGIQRLWATINLVDWTGAGPEWNRQSGHTGRAVLSCRARVDVIGAASASGCSRATFKA
jgi:transposase